MRLEERDTARRPASEPLCADCGCQGEQHDCLSEAGECLNTRCPTQCQRYRPVPALTATRREQVAMARCIVAAFPTDLYGTDTFRLGGAR